jgi:hypothetical protein
MSVPYYLLYSMGYRETGKEARGKKVDERGLRVWEGGIAKEIKWGREEGRIVPIHRMSERDMFIRVVQHWVGKYERGKARILNIQYSRS